MHPLRVLVATCLGLLLSACLHAQLDKIENLRLVPNGSADADSFLVTDGTDTWHFRLYFVDAPETDASDPTLARRVREQTRYFGLDDHAATLRFGRAATAEVKTWLAAPFTAYTSGARGLGRSTEPRLYAFIVTANGEDLGERLVRHGLARAYGVGRSTWQDISQAEQRAKLADLELAAAMAKRGIWAETDHERLAALRAEERKEGQELRAISAAAHGRTLADDDAVIDLNTATAQELESLPGVGPALSQRIIAGRPYDSIEELRNVSGIGATTLERLRPRVQVTAPAAP